LHRKVSARDRFSLLFLFALFFFVLLLSSATVCGPTKTEKQKKKYLPDAKHCTPSVSFL